MPLFKCSAGAASPKRDLRGFTSGVLLVLLAEDPDMDAWTDATTFACSGGTYHLFFSYFSCRNSFTFCGSLKSGIADDLSSNRPSQICLHTSFPCFCRNSISCCVKVVIEIDFTLWGGFKPRRMPEQEVHTKLPTVMSV